MIAFIGSVFSPYYHWAGRKAPQDHVAFNVALYRPGGNGWAMTERGRKSLLRTPQRLCIGNSRFDYAKDGDGLEIQFDEIALPWPGQRLLPTRISGAIRIEPEIRNHVVIELDPHGHHRWWPVFPRARISVESDFFPGGGWQGEAYHDFNAGDRPLETDFDGWDWARGQVGSEAAAILYDAVLKDGRRRTLGLSFSADGTAADFTPPPRHPLPRGLWGVGGGIGCDAGALPQLLCRLEDTPFYSRALVRTSLEGVPVTMVHEALNCRRLANPMVRLMLPFRMPRRTSA